MALVIAFLCSGLAEAQGLKIGFVDLQAFYGKSKRAKQQRKKLEDSYQLKRSGLEAKVKQFEDLKTDLQKKGALMNEDARNEKIKNIKMLETELQLARQKAETELKGEQRDLERKLLAELGKIFNRVRTDNGLDAIFNSMALFSIDDKFDVTEDVVRLYDSGAFADKGRPAPAPSRNKPRRAPRDRQDRR
jgi:outer membrane protein